MKCFCQKINPWGSFSSYEIDSVLVNIFVLCTLKPQGMNMAWCLMSPFFFHIYLHYLEVFSSVNKLQKQNFLHLIL